MFEGQGYRMKNVPFRLSMYDTRWRIHSESPESSVKRSHNAYAIYWLFVALNVLKWSVRPRVRAF